MSEYNLKTGDLLLFDNEDYSGFGFLSWVVEFKFDFCYVLSQRIHIK